MNALVQPRPFVQRLSATVGRIWVRLLLVNIVVVLVPIFGLEFARIYERQLLSALERDMKDQAAFTGALLESDRRRDIPLDDDRHRDVLERAARRTRTRVRVLDSTGLLVADSHAAGAPEGPEPEPPHYLRGSLRSDRMSEVDGAGRSSREADWPPISERKEVKEALAGNEATLTRVARRPNAVFLFVATPVLGSAPGGPRQVDGVVYVTRSTTPVLFELYRIRSGLFKVLLVTLCLSIATTLLLALSISHPLARLSKAAKRIAGGERGVSLPVRGSGEIRELAQSFRTMTEELDRRLVYISDFSADVAHEFKTPLTSIRGAAELLAEGAHADPAARARFLDNILLDTERLDRLVSRLLVLSRIEASADQMTLVDLRSLLDKVQQRASRRGQVDLRYASKYSWVRGREADLETAIGNLVENAQRYSPADRPVTITCGDWEDGVRISVQDEGPGIPEGRRTKIFARFYTTDADHGGTGLGLAIVDSVAKAHGGQVGLDAAVVRGSCFHFWLPSAGAHG